MLRQRCFFLAPAHDAAQSAFVVYLALSTNDSSFLFGCKLYIDFTFGGSTASGSLDESVRQFAHPPGL